MHYFKDLLFLTITSSSVITANSGTTWPSLFHPLLAMLLYFYHKLKQEMK